MHGQLKPQQIEMLIGSGPVREEFSQKIKEIDRRLKMNGLNYQQWDTLTDHQQGIFIDNLFLTGDCATSPEHYVQGAVESCGCPDTEEELHHHSPVLMREIEKQQEMLPDVTVRIGEGLSNLNETIDNILELLLVEAIQGTPEEIALKRYLTQIFTNNNIETSSYQRGYYQFRGDSPIPGSVDIEELKTWFSKFDLDVKERIPSISGDYYTFTVRARNKITAQDQKDKHGVSQARDIPAGSEIPYVPKVFVGQPAGGGGDKPKKQLKKKTTNPAGLEIASDSKQWGSALEIVTATKAGINNKFANNAQYPEWVAPELIALLEPAQRKGSPIPFDTPLTFAKSDLATISADYGEVLAAIWGMSQPQNQAFSLPYSEIIFPADPATKLLDFFAITDTGVKIPVSVKSGPTGGKVTIRNITETAEVLFQMSQGAEGAEVKDQQFIAVDRALDLAPKRSYEPLFVHKVLREDPANPNSPLGTRTIQVLAEIMSKNGAPGTTWQDLDVKQIADWLETKTNEELVGNRLPSLQDVTDKEGNKVKGYVEPKVEKGTGILEPLWAEANSKPKLDSWLTKGPDKNLLIYSPMGQQMIKLLNESPAIQAELNRLAQTLTVVQANVNVDGRQKYLSFQLNKFKDAEFVFDWPGYRAGNSLGFRMVIKK